MPIILGRRKKNVLKGNGQITFLWGHGGEKTSKSDDRNSALSALGKRQEMS